MLVDSIAETHDPLTEAEKAAVREQIDRLLATPYFSHSKRFPAFMRSVVQHALAGNADQLKERTLGVEIFGRTPDYDTAADPIVRVTAAEIRKRIAQYYQEPGREQEIRITLPAGSYAPHFQWPQAETAKEASAETVAAESIPLSSEKPVEPSQKFHAKRWILAGIAAVALVVATAAIVWRSTHHSPYDFFWGPILSSSDPVLFCVADQNQYSVIALRDALDPTHQTLLKDNLSAVVIDDLHPIVKIAGLMQSKNKKYSLKGEGVTDLTDLQNGPTVFIGAFDNTWTLRLTKPLRFHFGNNADMAKLWIADASHPDQMAWVVDRTQQLATNNYRDYGIVARFTDGNTGKLAIVVAGIGRGGTIAAGEFLTDPAYLEQLTKVSPGDGRKNMEIVLSTQIIDGQPGTPKIESAYFW